MVVIRAILFFFFIMSGINEKSSMGIYATHRMCRFVHNNKIVLFCWPMAKESAIIVDKSVLKSLTALYVSTIGRISVRGNLIHGQARERFTYACNTMRESDSTNQHGPLLLAFSHAKKGTNRPTMSPLWLSYPYDFFFSSSKSNWISTTIRAGCVCAGECVCVYIRGPYKRRVRSTDSLFLLRWGSFLNWPKRDSLTLDRERVVR